MKSGIPSNKFQKLLFCYIFQVNLGFFFLFGLELFYYLFSSLFKMYFLIYKQSIRDEMLSFY